MKIRDMSKCREWERRRRDRLTDAFKLLVELLPNYDPARIPPKIDILEKATQFIKELRMSNSRLVASQTQPTEMIRKVKDLQDEVNKLILRVKQLTGLLVKAKIPIPIGPFIGSLGKKGRKWTNKLRVEDVENIQITKDTPGSQSQIVKGLAPGKKWKTRITVIEEKDEGMPLDESTVPVPPKVLPVVSMPPPTTEPRHQPLTFSFPQSSTFILAPIQAQPTPPQLFTRINLSATLQQQQQQQHSILPKVLLTSSPLQKIPIKAIMKRIPRKIRKPRKSLPTKDKVGEKQNEKAELGTSTTVSAIGGAEQEKVISESGDKSQLEHNGKDDDITEMPHDNSQTIPFGSLSLVEDQFLQNEQLPVVECRESPISVPILNKPDHTTPISSDSEIRDHANKSVDHPPSADLTVTACAEIVTTNSTVDLERLGETDVETEVTSDVAKAIDDTTTTTKLLENDEIEAEIVPTKVIQDIPNSSQLEENVEPEKEQSENVTPKSQMEVNGDPKNGLLSTIMSLPPVNQEEPTRSVALEPKEVDRIPGPGTRVTFDDIVMSSSKCDMTMSPPPLPLPTASTSLCQPVSLDTEKMSECIARSIGLMEGSEETEAELMELGTDWGDVVGVSHSPKSPISPTQMFLSMFPLLPRESLVSSVPLETHQSQQPTHKSCRSSFFIDSMLPMEESQPGMGHFGQSVPPVTVVKNKTGNGDSLDTILAPLQTLTRDKQRTNNEILSLSAFLNLGEPMGLVETNTKDKQVLLPKNPTLTPLHPLGGNQSLENPGSLYQNFNQAQTHDLFFPNYNHLHTYQSNKGQEAIPTPPITSHAQPQFHQQQSGFQAEPSYTFRHNYSDAGFENLHNSNNIMRTNQIVTNQAQQPSPAAQKKDAVPSAHAHKKNSPKTGIQQGGSAASPAARAHSFQFVDPNRMSLTQDAGQKAQAQVRTRQEGATFTYPQGDQQNRTHRSAVEERGQVTSYPSYPTATQTQGQGQAYNFQGPAGPTFQSHFPQTLPTSFQSGSGSHGNMSISNDRLSRPFYAPPPNKAPPPFYLTPPHQHQTPVERSAGNNPQFSHPRPDFYNPPSQVKSGNPPQYNNNRNNNGSEKREYVQPQQSPQYAQMQGQVNRGLHSIPTSEQGQKKVPNFPAQAQNPGGSGQSQGQRQRPVNWMTDSPYKKTNPFSVSKLVGPQNSNYGDAVVKQNRNTWNDVQFTTPRDIQAPQPLTQVRTQYQPCHDGYGQQGGQGQETYEQRTSHHHHHFHPQHQTHFTSHHQSNSSNSISNFNLSSIFPEITSDREKGQGKVHCPSNYYGTTK